MSIKLQKDLVIPAGTVFEESSADIKYFAHFYQKDVFITPDYNLSIVVPNDVFEHDPELFSVI